ncbi:MAG: prepilin peptidase [Planctomycetota bacterium]
MSLLILASYIDLRTREIPDWISISIALIAVAGSLTGWLGLELIWVIGGGLVGLGVAYVLFRFARLGGGDAKLIASLGMLVGPVGIWIVLFGMALAGGALSTVAIFRNQRDLAYVPAITAGFIGYLGIIHFVI